MYNDLNSPVFLLLYLHISWQLYFWFTRNKTFLKLNIFVVANKRSKVFTCLCGQEITTRAQKLLERFNLTYCHCSNKQSGWCQMQKILLNNSDQSLRLISMNKYHDLRRHVDCRRLRLCEDCNKTVWRCAANWLKQKDVNVHAVLYQLLKCEVKQTKD